MDTYYNNVYSQFFSTSTMAPLTQTPVPCQILGQWSAWNLDWRYRNVESYANAASTNANVPVRPQSTPILSWPQIDLIQREHDKVKVKWEGYEKLKRLRQELVEQQHQTRRLNNAVYQLHCYVESAINRDEMVKANKRARVLLRDVCTEEQWAQWLMTGWITVINKTSGRKYRVDIAHKIERIGPLGVPDNRYCIVVHPEPVPDVDRLIAKLLLATYDDTTLTSVGVPEHSDPGVRRRMYTWEA